jgi:diguanylate cyclase (GGDEF)-like protein
MIAVSVEHDPTRLQPNADLLDRVSGVAAHATTALQNGRLVDHFTHQARHDPLTGLPNRAGFDDTLDQASQMAREKAVTLFYLDLDGFKDINDNFGHYVGDQLLCAVGDRLKQCLRDDDTVARLGGDEFALLLTGAGDGPQADLMMARVMSLFDAPFQIGELSVKVGASVGRAIWQPDIEDLDELVRRADASMYEVKHAHHAQASANHTTP